MLLDAERNSKHNASRQDHALSAIRVEGRKDKQNAVGLKCDPQHVRPDGVGHDADHGGREDQEDGPPARTSGHAAQSREPVASGQRP